jgi:fused signal recognition particle receptor
MSPPRKDGKPTVILVAGVNGVGKTTSVAKLASFLKTRGNSVVLAAADTFRAAAIEQLNIWADRVNVPLVSTQYQGDPSAVCFDAHEKAIAIGADYLICDTAGRLHTRHNLMEELKKISRTLAKQDETAPHERWIVVDATTGSNALSQTKEFGTALDLTGVIATKLDGSGKAGSIVAIKHDLDVPTRFIGTGEKEEDFSVFDPRVFIETIL